MSDTRKDGMMSAAASPEPPPEQVDALTARMRSFLQGELVLAELYEITHEELFDIATQGKHLYESGQLDSARKVFEGLTALDPCESHFHTGLGAVYQKQGDLALARVEYDRALALDARDIAALCNRAELLLQQGQVEEAAADLRRITELDPQGAQDHTQRARGLSLALGALATRSQAQEAR
jgi:Flp pilus assembly protein TadD